MISRMRTTVASCVAALAALACALGASPALAAEGKPQWTIVSTSAPSYFAVGDSADEYVVSAINTGAAPTSGAITVDDVLPVGMTATHVYASNELKWPLPSAVTCTTAPVKCETSEEMPVGDQITLTITVEVNGPFATPPVNEASVSGGGALQTAVTGPNTQPANPPTVISERQVPPGVAAYRVALSSTQAGAHPNLTTTFVVNQASASGREPTEPKDVEISLPKGLLGDASPAAVPRCDMYKVINGQCPPDTIVGISNARMGVGPHAASFKQFVYNIAPYKGEPAAFAFAATKLPVRIDTSVLPDGEYAAHVAVKDISQQEALAAATVTLWGVPHELNGSGSDSFYNVTQRFARESFGAVGSGTDAPLLTNPTSCEAPLSSSLVADYWVQPGKFGTASTATLPAMTGCDELRFRPALDVRPMKDAADTPAAYEVNLEVQQKEGAQELATPEIRDVEVTLPEGTALSPSGANGLAACSDAEIALNSGLPGKCPGASKIGSVVIVSPLLTAPVEGSVYVGTPECEPCTSQDTEAGQMVPLLLEAELPGKPESPDVMIKLKGHTTVDQRTGRLTTTFANDPQLPFSKLDLSLKGGEDAPLVNPSTCGPAVATGKLTPWSSTTPTEVMASPIHIEGCDPAGFSPSLQAGMTKSARGDSFSPFSVTLERPGGQQSLGAVTVHMPPGISGMLSRVPLCGEGQANAGTCPASSQIGTTTAVIGPGSEPYTVEGGKVYLTEKYGGGSFGLSIVTPAHAGPFTLAGLTGTGAPGNGTVVIRAAIDVDPHTAAITIKTQPLPTQLNGIPLDIDRVIVNVDREGFMFNPTDCNAMSVTGTIMSSTGAAANVSYPFQSNDCASLPFKPTFKALIHAHHSRKDGEYLHVVIGSAFGQANLAKVHVRLPGRLPSRDSTLKMACSEAQFAANPAGCPAGSFVGHAVVHTPVLAKPLVGPAIFVSHGGRAFPNLDLVLQGEGVTIINEGDTFIGKKGVTTSSFNAIPDVPVSRISLVLAAGPHSALAGTGNMCARTLRMPTRLTGQNGAVVSRKTKVMVEGCRAQILLRKRHVHGAKATIILHVPSAGRLTANGHGIGKVSKRVTKHGGRVGITVRLKRHFRRLLARHRHRHAIAVTVHLRFKPGHGKAIRRRVKVRLR